MNKRLINFYKATNNNDIAEAGMHELWEGITRVHHSELSKTLRSGNEQEVEALLNRFGETSGLHGIEYLPLFQKWSMDNPQIRRLKLTDVDMRLPDFLGFKCEGVDGGIPHRFPLHCDAALSIRKHLKNTIPNRVLEIGAGLGFLAVIFCRWGVKAYSIIDLPSTLVLAAVLLSKVFGRNRIWMYGEPMNEFHLIRLYPSTDCRGVLNSKYDLVINFNSFPEFAWNSQDVYLEYISKCLAPTGTFISINHESHVLNQRSVAEAMEKQDRLVCVCREPCGIEYLEGYFTELYRLAA